MRSRLLFLIFFTLSSPVLAVERVVLYENGNRVRPCSELAELKGPLDLVFSDGKVIRVVAFLGARFTTCIFKKADGGALRVEKSALAIREWVDAHPKIFNRPIGKYLLKIPELKSYDTVHFEYAEVKALPLKFNLDDYYRVKYEAVILSAPKTDTRAQSDVLSLEELKSDRKKEYDEIVKALADPIEVQKIEAGLHDFLVSSAPFTQIGDSKAANVGWTGQDWYLFDWNNKVQHGMDEYDDLIIAKLLPNERMISSEARIELYDGLRSEIVKLRKKGCRESATRKRLLE